MAAQQRIEYHWIENRIVTRTITRPPHTIAWRFDTDTRTVIATIEAQDRSFYLREGSASTPERIVDCVRHFKGVLVDESTEDFSVRMPAAVREELRAKLDEAIKSVQPQWGTFAEETDITGFLKGRLNGIAVEGDGWRVSVKSWTYRRNPKENTIGADLGVIFDVLSSGGRLIKAIWYQAKIVRGITTSLVNVPDLADQVDKMKRYTDESYVLLYTPDVIVTTPSLTSREFNSLTDNLVDGAICVKGDRNPIVIANTVDIKHVVEIYITAP